MQKSQRSVFFALLLAVTLQMHAQIIPGPSGLQDHKNLWQFSVRAGYDKPFFSNNQPYIKYKGGITAGASIDHYWGKIGLGGDFDYIKNKPKSKLPLQNLINLSGTSLNSFTLTENNITRLFYGIGPDYKFQSSTGKYSFEINTRVGLSSITGGRVELVETSTPDLLNFHAGYNSKSLLATKLQLRNSYFFTPNFGISAGVYYLRQYNAQELFDPVYNLSAKYQPTKVSGNNNVFDGAAVRRIKPCNCDVYSIGVFAGVVFRPGAHAGKQNYTLVVTAKDKYTGILLPNTQVMVKDISGKVVYSGITNNNGSITFTKVLPADYTIEGTLNTVALEGSNVSKNDFTKNKIVKKEILYTDRGFIVKGKIFECNSTRPVAGTTVVLENAADAFKKTTLTDADGSFVFYLPQTGNFKLYGKKENFFSQVEDITPVNYDRDKNLFIKLEICGEIISCDKTIKLNNILFDLDKWDIKESAKSELNKLVRFMTDNPGVRVELGSHTDSRASKEYNQTLSQKRAEASVAYIVSQGISKDRIVAKGYGESKLLNECADGVNCSEAQHAINRRTEMKVICNSNN